jgi:hypothetical protein
MKKKAKKIIIIVSSIIAFLLLLMILLPIFFKNDLMNLAKKEINKNLNAEVNFTDFGLNLFSSFPNFSFSLDNLTVIGKDEFAKDTLANLKNFKFVLDLMSVISGDKVKIIAVEINEPKIFAHVDTSGKANWNITKPSAEIPKEEKKDTVASKFNVHLKRYAINNADIIFKNDSSNMSVELKNFSHSGKGDFSQDKFVLETRTTADEVTFSNGGVKFLNKVKPDIKFDIEIDNLNKKFTFKENYVKMNEFQFSFDGFVQMLKDNNMNMDINFKSNKNEFKSILSMVPSIFKKNFDKIKTSGSFVFNGSVKGNYGENVLPAFNFNLKVDNSMFQYPDLPDAAENINMDLTINKSEGPADNTVINMNKFHIEFAKNPFDAKLIVKTPVSDPDIDAKFTGKIDLANVIKIIPMEDVNKLAGIANMDLILNGKSSFVEKEEYESFKADGKFELNNLEYEAKDTKPIKIPKILMEFNPKNVDLKACNVLIGSSDLEATGSLSNFIPFALKKKEVLKGNLNLSSRNLNLDEIMAKSGAEQKQANVQTAETQPVSKLSAPEIPDNIDFSLNTHIDKMKFDNLEYTNISGGLKIKDQKVILGGEGNNKYFQLSALEGSFGLNGQYDPKIPQRPRIDFDLFIKDLDIQKSAEQFVTIKNFAPVAKNASGKFTSSMKLTSQLKDDMMPSYESINANGSVNLNNVEIKNLKILTEIADKLKIDKFKQLALNNTKFDFEIKNGKIIVKPFTLNVYNSKMTVSGSNSLDQTIDYEAKIDIPRSQFGENANNIISGLTNKVNKLGVTLKPSEIINVILSITGKFDDPKVSPKFSNPLNTQEVTDQIKDKVNEEIDKKKKELEDKAKEIEKKAQEEVDKKKKELEEKAKQEAEKKKKELEDKVKKEAQDKLKKLFK